MRTVFIFLIPICNAFQTEQLIALLARNWVKKEQLTYFTEELFIVALQTVKYFPQENLRQQRLLRLCNLIFGFHRNLFQMQLILLYYMYLPKIININILKS